MHITRRNFLVLFAGAAFQADHRPKRDMSIRSARPEDLEMPLSGFSDYITPVDRFFVRTHVYVPVVRPAEWRLTVDGQVATPLTFTLDDLRRLPSTELISVVECAGNGRSFYDPPVPGVQWANGAVGNARWRGVRLADLLKRAGLKSSAREILFNGADVPIGTMPDFQRSIPLKKGLDPNTLLAYEMNGQPLDARHGFPLRVVVPGWAGDCWIKWLTSIRVLDSDHDGFWMTNAYRHPGGPVAPGTAVALDQMRPVTSLRVKSVIAAPENGAQVLEKTVVAIRGVAWSGDSAPVDAVDVSVDSGRTWNRAMLRANQQTQFGWRQWEFTWRPAAASYHTILARARDAAGNIQPLHQEWNPMGYNWNVVPRVGVDVVRELSDRPSPTTRSGSGEAPPEVFRNTCLGCHGDDLIRQQGLTREQWEREIRKMIDWGARVAGEDRATLLDYLADNFAPPAR